MGRPKGSKNKSTLLKQRFTLSDPLENFSKNSNNSPPTEQNKEEVCNHTPDNEQKILDQNFKENNNKKEEDLAETPVKEKSKKEEKGNICECCKKRVLYDLYRVDTNVLTGKADYHRSTPRYVKICNDCANNLSKLVENWLLNNGIEKKKGW